MTCQCRRTSRAAAAHRDCRARGGSCAAAMVQCRAGLASLLCGVQHVLAQMQALCKFAGGLLCCAVLCQGTTAMANAARYHSTTCGRHHARAAQAVLCPLHLALKYPCKSCLLLRVHCLHMHICVRMNAMCNKCSVLLIHSAMTADRRHDIPNAETHVLRLCVDERCLALWHVDSTVIVQLEPC